MNSLQRLGRGPQTSQSLRADPTLKLWDEFLEAWPPDRVRSMSLDEYTNLDRDDAFIYWLEFRTKALGSISGGDAIKFGIYRRKDKDPKRPERGRIYGDEYAWWGKYGETAEEAFATVRSRLMQVIDAARKGNIAAVDDVNVCWPFVKWKVAFLYQDREDPRILALYKEDLLAARYKEAFPTAVKAPPSHEQHAALIEHYSWLGDALDISPDIWLGPNPPARYWLMALGKNADLWPGCYKSGVASIGYDDHPVGDLLQYGSREKVGRAIGSESGPELKNTRSALWEFSHEMAPGDVIFVKMGRQLVVGHGAVTSQYRYDPTKDEHRHLRDVDWKSNFPDGRPVRGTRLGIKALTDITEDPEQVAALKAAVELPETARVPGRGPRNILLYGPPGTGKTYATVGRALAIIDRADPKNSLSTRDRDRFCELRLRNPAGPAAAAEGRIAMVTFHQNYAYEDFVEGIRPRLAEPDKPNGEAAAAGASPSSELGYELRPGIFRRICEAAERERQTAEDEAREPERFVLIIDEINRGNIPKIFGELITLIEASRRLGEDDETTVTLPYSGDEFGVPDNLYIIGTMNTADRSIQQLDTALRRRFTFVEMMPDPDHELIPEAVDGVNCRKMLRAMNERIALLMDREHQIGHTYLLEVESIEDLADRFRNRIFPLLQEYFYDDWRRIDAVLGGNAFVQKDKARDGHSKQLIEKFDLLDEDRVIHERLADNDPAWKAAEEYQRIYEPKSD